MDMSSGFWPAITRTGRSAVLLWVILRCFFLFDRESIGSNRHVMSLRLFLCDDF